MERLTYKKSRSRWDKGKYPTKYTSRHTFQEVVARLAAYEDTGLGPEEIPERMIPLPPVCYKEDGDGCAYQTYDGTDGPIDECKECPLCYVDKRRHREAPNDPLTLEELREMDGDPVYDRMGYEWFIVCEVTDDEVIMTDGTVFDIDEDSPNTVGQRFCRREPEEGTP